MFFNQSVALLVNLVLAVKNLAVQLVIKLTIVLNRKITGSKAGANTVWVPSAIVNVSTAR